MSAGLLDQLDAYFSEFDERQGSITDDQVAERLDQVREVPKPVPVTDRPSTQPWIPMAVAAVIVAVVIGLIPLIASLQQDDSPPVTEPPQVSTTIASSTTLPPSPTTTAPATTTTVAAESSTPPPGASAERLTDAQSGGPNDGMPIGGDRFVLVDNSFPPDSPPVAWESPDGVNWTSVDLPDFSYAVAVASFGEIVLLDTDLGPVTTTDFAAFESWLGPTYESESGEEFVAVPWRAVAIQGGSRILAETRQGLIVMGAGFTNPAFVQPTFGRSPQDFTDGDVRIAEILATDERFYAFLNVYNPSSGGDPEVWSSADGITWEQVDAEVPLWRSGSDPGAEYQIAARGDHVLLFVGTGRGSGVSSWWSYREGSSGFAPVDGPYVPGGEINLVAAEDGYLAVYTQGIHTGDFIPRLGPVVVTSDGSAWSEVDLDVGFSLVGAAVGNTILTPVLEWEVDRNSDGSVSGQGTVRIPGAWDVVTLSPTG